MVKKRELKGIQLLAETGNVKQMDPSNFLVRSETDPDAWYDVTWQRYRWACNCADYAKCGKKCKHIYAVSYYLALGEISRAAKNPADVHKCPICERDDLTVKNGTRYNRSGPLQRYYCKRCKVRFVSRSAFAGMRNSAAVITTALDLYFRGLSMRKISDHLWACHRIKVTHATIYNWIKRYVELVSKYVEDFTPKVSRRWHADESMVRVNGRHMVLWGLLDSETRYLLALLIGQSHGSEEAGALLRKGLESSKDAPEEVVTDGNPSYPVAIEKEQRPGSNPIVHIQGPLIKGLNNRMERLFGTVKNRTKTMSRFRSKESASKFAQGFKVHYNFVKPHRGLDWKTPAQVAGLRLERSNWLELIEEAAKIDYTTAVDPAKVKNKADPTGRAVNKETDAETTE